MTTKVVEVVALVALFVATLVEHSFFRAVASAVSRVLSWLF